MNISDNKMMFDASISSNGGVNYTVKSEQDVVKIKKTKKTKQENIKNKNESQTIESVINTTTETIKELIKNEKYENDDKYILSHLGEYIEEPFNIIESYFGGQHLERLVRHQIESYNHFINFQIQRTIQMFNPVIIHSENDYVLEHSQYFLEIQLDFDNFKLYPPQIHENNGATKMMLPHEAKLRNFTYASTMTVDLQIQYIVRNTEMMDTPKIIKKTLPKINIGKMPIMIKSSICVLSQNRHIHPSLTGECPMDCGGYFIVKGSEKTVLGQERAAENRVYCFDGKNTTKWNWFAEIKSVPDFKCISPKQIEMMIASKNNGFGNGLYMTIPRIKQPVELFVIFRALGIISDKEICEHILLDIEDAKYHSMLECLQASIIDANKYLTQEDAMKHITGMVAYTPLNMDRETGLRKKREFAVDVLNNDLFPHCKTVPQKIYLIGYMAKKLIQTSLGMLPPDDRDSYLNKRIELTGTLLNNLFRNYFNKLVKEMQKQIIREINTGSWRSTEDYENIINMTNIYKIMKSTTIENGITRALSTGDFSIKQANSSKVGVAQVLNRLTYLSSLSHLRRINTPLEKSGELIAPRKLHNTTFGFLCLTGDTEILLSNGMDSMRMDQIRDGYWVTTINRENLKDEPSPIHSFFKKMPEKLFEITTCSGRKIKGTEEHPLFVHRGNGVCEMVEIGELKETDCLVVRHTVKMIPNDNTTIVHIKEEDVLKHYKMELMELCYVNRDIPVYKLKILARLIGAINTDGHLRESEEKGKKYYYASFYVGENKDVYQIANDISELGFGRVSINQENNTFEDKKNNRICNNTVWKVSKGGAFAYLLYLLGGFAGKKTQMKRSVPEWLVNSELSIKREFLSGFQGGNGSRLSYQYNTGTYKCHIGLTSQTTYNEYLEETEKYMTQIVTMFSEFGINSKVYNTPSIIEGRTCVNIIFEQTCENLVKYADTIYYAYCEEKRRASAPTIEHLKIKDFCQRERQQKYDYIIENYSSLSIETLITKTNITENQIRKVVEKNKKENTHKEIYETYMKDNILTNNCISVKIHSIKEIEPEIVYDFTTYSDNHNFVANSIVSSNCCCETPEGQSIGVVKNISYMAHITIPTNSSSLYEYVQPYIKPVESTPCSEMNNKVKVFVNGAWLGITENPMELYTEMKEKKYKGIINIYTSIVFDFKLLEIRICNDGGRLTRPVLRVKDNKALITSDIINKLVTKKIGWNDLLTNCRIDESVIEYIDPEEQNHAMIAMKSKDSYLKDPSLKINYTHCEIHPSTIFGVLASCIPFPEHNQAPRNCYQCAMSKQAIGVYATNYDQRMDKTSYILTYPSRPLVDTRIMNFIELNKIPSGSQIHVAIMTHTGYNQEDSVLVNKGSIDRGLFSATIYHTEKDEDKNIVRDEIIRCKPDKTKTKSIKFGNYEKLNSQGFIPENTLVENRDVIIAKIIPIKENRNDPTKTIKYEDQSKTFRTTEETYIDKNYTGRNGDGYNFAKVRVRTFRKPVLGDKFCQRPTTQVLTNYGWIEIQYVDITKHKLCTLDVNGNMCYEFPTAKFEYEHDGDMYYLENKQVHVVCTLNHRLYVRKRSAKWDRPYELIEAKDVMGKMVRFQKSMNNIYPDIETICIGDIHYNMDAWLQLIGMFISDGWTDKHNKRIMITSIKERKNDFNREIFEKLEIKYSYHKGGIYYISGSKYENIYNSLKSISLGALHKKLPNYIWNLSQRQSRVLLEALIEGDGSRMVYKTEEFSRYGTISIQLANDIARLAVHCGYSSIVKIAEEPTGIARIGKRTLGSRAGTDVSITQRHTYYRVSIITKQNQPYINKKNNESNTEKIIKYTGKIYCVEMPSSHTYYMRETSHSPSLIIGNSSRHGQKGTCGNIIEECDMPFTKEGLRPDIIINPHAIPSRMTIAQLKETLLGKVLLHLGLFGDGTSFGNLDIKSISEQLQKNGYEGYGNEIMYNGYTGEQLETSIFIGPVFYQRLKHMVNDKQHSRSIGPMVNLTRQPAEGRSRDGGFRIGEMERDVMLAHGMSKFCRERLFDVSDKYSVYTCKKCGMIASYNNGDKYNRLQSKGDFTIHLCKTCGNTTDFALVEVPYAYKLLSQELQTINVVPRIITE
jgi:DNA-directed RNA polymerase beta subunit